jgi:hypothetical protein
MFMFHVEQFNPTIQRRQVWWGLVEQTMFVGS